jgi:chemotaxis protein CheD
MARDVAQGSARLIDTIERLVTAMVRLGSDLDDLDAKVFDGAAVLPMHSVDNNIGGKNVDVAIERLSAVGIPVIARRTGGKNGMTIRLLTESGDALVRRIASSVAWQADPLPPTHDSNRG